MGRKKSKKDDGGSLKRVIEPTLERIMSNASADNEFPLYKLVNYRRGGSILESYAGTGSSGIGAKEVDKICKEHLVHYVYNGGLGRKITTMECLTWRCRRLREVSVSVTMPNDDLTSNSDNTFGHSSSANRNPMAPYNFPEDHEACWMLEQRGALGENPLHVLVICDTPTHTRVAKIILNHYPKMASDIIEGSEYYGLSPLHLAVAYKNMELVQAFIQAGSNVNERALGRFFMPTDQQVKPKRKTNYAGLSYLGEYALSWAACSENEAIYNYLLDQGADPNLQDTFGNMLLHMVVISDKLGMYGYALRHPKKPANNEIINKAGLTPLTLACVLGRNNIFREMLELSSVEFWRFSNITCSAYPLIALDTIKPDGGTNWKSVLMIILNGETDEHLDMLEGGVVQRLLEDKWKTFARNQFLKRLAFLFLHLLVISIAVYLRPKYGETLGWSSDAKTIIRHCAEIGSLVGCAIFVFVQQGSEIHSQGLIGFLTNLARSPAKLVFLVSNICILSCIPFRFLNLRLVEDSILTFALPGTWFFLMFFAGAVRLTGPFVTMIYSMIAGDMVRFGIIYLIMLTGFSQALYFLFKSCYVGKRDADETNIDLYATYFGTWMALYHMTLGSYQYSDFTKPKYSGLSMSIFVIFMVLVPILLLNMLIAMMGNTYANVISKSEKEFVKQWAKIVLALERAVSKNNAKEHLDAYGIKLAPPPDAEPGVEYKGLMVIKSKSKTKAQQRKGALLNWRRMGKRIVGEMRRYGCKGESLLTSMAQGAPKKIQRRSSFSCILDTGDDEFEEDGAEPPPPAKGGLGEALSQLAFTHDLDLAGVNSMPSEIPLQNSIPSAPATTVLPPSCFSALPTSSANTKAANGAPSTPSSASIATPVSCITAAAATITTTAATTSSTTIVMSMSSASCTTTTVAATSACNNVSAAATTANTNTMTSVIPTTITNTEAFSSATASMLKASKTLSISHSSCKAQVVMPGNISPEQIVTSGATTIPTPVASDVKSGTTCGPNVAASPSSSVSPVSYLVPMMDGLDTPPPPLIFNGCCDQKSPVEKQSVSVEPQSQTPLTREKSVLPNPSNSEVVMVPSDLKFRMDSVTAATHLTAAAHRRNSVNHKGKKRAKSGFPIRIRKLTNKVAATSSFVLPTDCSRSSGQRSMSSRGYRSSNNALPISRTSQMATFATVSGTTPADPPLEPIGPPTLLSHPLNRWSTTSLASMASLVAWEDGDYCGSDSDQS